MTEAPKVIAPETYFPESYHTASALAETITTLLPSWHVKKREAETDPYVLEYINGRTRSSLRIEADSDHVKSLRAEIVEELHESGSPYLYPRARAFDKPYVTVINYEEGSILFQQADYAPQNDLKIGKNGIEMAIQTIASK